MFSINAHSSIRIEGERTVYFDPYGLDGNSPRADIVFITHSHYDHFSPADIKKCSDEKTLLVAPASCREEFSKKGFENAVFMSPNEEISIMGIKVRAVPAYNKSKPFHPKDAGWQGYVVTLNGKSYYVAGDTDALEENLSIKCHVAFLPVGGTYTMDFGEAAEFANRLAPETVVPTHYGSIVGDPDDGLKFAGLVNKSIHTEILIGSNK